MRYPLLPGLVGVCLLVFSHRATMAGDDANKPLQGVWVAESMEVDGKPAPAKTVQRMQFTFKGDKLFMRGNFKDDRELECAYKIDTKQSPKHIDITPSDQKMPILGIYELEGDKLKACLRHASSSKGRPIAFGSEADSNLVLVVFKKQKR